MARVVLLTGGNTGDVKRTLQAAQQLINARVGAVLRCSHRYESKPWGFDAEQHFSNQALEVSTDLQPLEVLEAVQAIEQELGRNRAAEAVEKARTGVAYTSRPIDIDILFYDDEVIASERLTVPHPLLSEREFALAPLCEISAATRSRGRPWRRCTRPCARMKIKKERTLKRGRIITLFTAVVLFAGCFKEVSYRTDYVLKPLVQENSGDVAQLLPEGKAQAFAHAADTVFWEVASYEDALAGIITRRDNPTEKQTVPLVTAEPYQQEGIAGWLSMRIDKPSVMVVAVDTEHRIYGYTQQEIAENFPKLYVSVVFKPWKEGTEYKDGNWIFRNQFYVPPTYLDCYIAPSVQAEEDGETTEPSKLKAYAYAVDTTAWRIASYIDAAAGVITSKNDPSQTRSNPNFTASKEESGAYGMEVSSPTLMVVVVDQTNEVYAYSKQEVDLDGEPVTFPIVFRTWRPEYLYVEEGWRVVNEKNADPEQEGSDTTK